MSEASSSTMVSRTPAPHKRTKTVAVMGAAYGGARAAKLLSEGLPEDWKLVVIDRNTHFNRTSLSAQLYGRVAEVH
jgi:NADH dehydrogenase FAD-containing subunit